MTRETSFRLGVLQLRIIKILWRAGTTTVGDVQEQLVAEKQGEPLAYTTIATMLRKMEDRGLVTHHEEGRKFIYRAAVSQDEVTRSMAGDLVDRLFEGSLSMAVSHLLDMREVSEQELAGLERLIHERKKDRGS